MTCGTMGRTLAGDGRGPVKQAGLSVCKIVRYIQKLSVYDLTHQSRLNATGISIQCEPGYFQQLIRTSRRTGALLSDLA